MEGPTGRVLTAGPVGAGAHRRLTTRRRSRGIGGLYDLLDDPDDSENPQNPFAGWGEMHSVPSRHWAREDEVLVGRGVDRRWGKAMQQLGRC